MNCIFKTNTIIGTLIVISVTSCQKHVTGNPYIDSKVSVSQKQLKEEQKITVQQNKAYAEQLEKNKKDILENNNRFFEKKKQYKHLTRRKRNKSYRGQSRF